jgi:hypothetical protein
MDHVQQLIQSVVSEFGVEEIVTGDSKIESTSSESCRQSVKVVIDKRIEAARNKICEVAIQKVLHIYPFYYISRINWIPSGV